MNAVLGMTDLAMQTDLSEEQREYVSTAHSAASSLLVIIDDLLDFSKVEAGRLRLESTRFALQSSLGQALRALAVRAQAKGIALLVPIDDNVPDSIVGDPHRLAQVLVNLVSNAIKFTDRGEIVVRVSAGESTPTGGRIGFEVTDSGIGIAEDKLSLIFDAFAQAEESTTRRFGGTGLGLAICKQLVSAMGGQIAVTSELGRGSTFRFALDFADPVHDSVGVGPTALRGARVLVVDPSATSRAILAERLTAWGAECELHASLPEAARRATRGRLDLVIVDGTLGAAGGVALCRRSGATRVPLLLVGAPNHNPEDLLTGWVSKPVLVSDLLETTLSLRARAILEHAGHTVVPVTTGRMALAALVTESFDVVLMDVQMPEMDGLEATSPRARSTAPWSTKLRCDGSSATSH